MNVSQLKLRSKKFDDDNEDDDNNNNNNNNNKLQIRPPGLFLLITYPRIGECFSAEAEK